MSGHSQQKKSFSYHFTPQLGSGSLGLPCCFWRFFTQEKDALPHNWPFLWFCHHPMSLLTQLIYSRLTSPSKPSKTSNPKTIHQPPTFYTTSHQQQKQQKKHENMSPSFWEPNLSATWHGRFGRWRWGWSGAPAGTAAARRRFRGFAPWQPVAVAGFAPWKHFLIFPRV